MTLTLRQLADQIGGELVGDGNTPITNARTLTEAGPGDITFVDSDRHLAAWDDSPATAAVVPNTVPQNGRPLIRVADPISAFAAILSNFVRPPDLTTDGRIDPRAAVHPTATVGPGTTIGPFAVVGEGTTIGANCRLEAGVTIGRDCHLGDEVVLHPHVVAYDGCTLGDRVIVHANSVIGADGFGYRTQAGKHVKVPQMGTVEIGDDVEIGACSTVDRGTFGATRIGTGTKIDNLVIIAHNCQIGRHNLLVSQVGIAGSSRTGDYVVMAGQVGVADHVTVGDRVVVGAQAGVLKDVGSDCRLLGMPAKNDREQIRIWVASEKLPQLLRDVRRLKGDRTAEADE